MSEARHQVLVPKSSVALFLLAVCGLCCMNAITQAALYVMPSNSANAPAKNEDATDGDVQQSKVVTIEREGVHLQTRVNRLTCQVADPVRLSLRVTVSEGQSVEFPELDDTWGQWQIVSRKIAEEIPVGSGQQSRRYSVLTLVLETYNSGVIQIPPIPVSVVPEPAGDNGRDNPTPAVTRLLSSELEINVESLLDDSETGTEVRDIKSVVELPRRDTSPAIWVRWTIGIVAAAGLVALLTIVWLRVKRPAASPTALALAAIEKLDEQELIEAGKLTSYFTSLIDILRHYIERQFDIRAPNLTTPEFLEVASGQRRFSAQRTEQLQQLLSTADQVKFAADTLEKYQIVAARQQVMELIQQDSATS